MLIKYTGSDSGNRDILLVGVRERCLMLIKIYFYSLIYFYHLDTLKNCPETSDEKWER